MENDYGISWYALHTKPHQEHRAADFLALGQIESLVPQLPSKPGSAPRAFFPGYIFARFDLDQMLHKVKFSRGVAYVVSFGGKPFPVQLETIDLVRGRMDAKGIVQPSSRFSPGDVVRVNSGPMRDLAGVFERDLPDAERVRILLSTIGYSARIEVPRTCVTGFAETAQ